MQTQIQYIRKRMVHDHQHYEEWTEKGIEQDKAHWRKMSGAGQVWAIAVLTMEEERREGEI